MDLVWRPDCQGVSTVYYQTSLSPFCLNHYHQYHSSHPHTYSPETLHLFLVLAISPHISLLSSRANVDAGWKVTADTALRLPLSLVYIVLIHLHLNPPETPLRAPSIRRNLGDKILNADGQRAREVWWGVMWMMVIESNTRAHLKAEYLLFRDTIHSGMPSPSLYFFVEGDVRIYLISRVV